MQTVMIIIEYTVYCSLRRNVFVFRSCNTQATCLCDDLGKGDSGSFCCCKESGKLRSKFSRNLFLHRNDEVGFCNLQIINLFSFSFISHILIHSNMSITFNLTFYFFFSTSVKCRVWLSCLIT